MDHSDDQLDFAQDDDLNMQQEIMLLKVQAFRNSSMTKEEYDMLEKEIREKYSYKNSRMIIEVSVSQNTGYHKQKPISSK